MALWCVLLLCALVAVEGHGIESPVDFVNMQAGTYTDGRRFSTGNTLPLIGMPWGFNHWAAQTQGQNRQGTAWWFDGNSHDFHWMRCTHQPSPWIGDWAWFLFAPMVGKMDMNPHSFWEPRAAVMKPHLFDATVADVRPPPHPTYIHPSHTPTCLPCPYLRMCLLLPSVRVPVRVKCDV